MRAKVQITVEWELASPDDYPPNTVNSWLEAAAYERCLIRIDTSFADFDGSTDYGVPELVGDPETEPFVRSADLDGDS